MKDVKEQLSIDLRNSLYHNMRLNMEIEIRNQVWRNIGPQIDPYRGPLPAIQYGLSQTIIEVLT
jgi:hypothetical protein